MAFQTLGGGFGAGDGAVKRQFVLGQCVDEAVGGGAGTHPDDAVGIQMWQQALNGGLSYRLFHFVLGHLGSSSLAGQRVRLYGVAGARV